MSRTCDEGSASEMASAEPEGETHSVSEWIEELRAGCPRAAEQLWDRYYSKMVAYSSRKIPFFSRRDFDSEDVAISAFHSLCDGVSHGRFPELGDRESLWALVAVITARKIYHQMRTHTAAKRGGNAMPVGLDAAEAAGAISAPEFAAQVSDEAEHLLSVLPDDTIRAIARMKSEGLSNGEIADSLNCGLRTVERRLDLIRRIWTEDLRNRLDG